MDFNGLKQLPRGNTMTIDVPLPNLDDCVREDGLDNNIVNIMNYLKVDIIQIISCGRHIDHI